MTMTLRSKPPVLVPREYSDEFAKLSEARSWTLSLCRVARFAFRNRADPQGNLGRVPGQVGVCSTAPRGLMRSSGR